MEIEADGSLPTSQVWILAPSCQGSHHKIRPKGHSPTKTRGFPFQICENPDLISQNWPHRDLKRTSIYKTLKNQAHWRKHMPPRAAISFGNRNLVLQICANLPTISENKPYQEILRPPIYKTQEFRDQKSSHAPPATSAFTSSDSRADNSHLHAPRAYMLHTCAFLRYDVTDDVIVHYLVWPKPT